MNKARPEILGIITARGGSKGIPGKNVKPLGGKPLIAYTILAAKQSKLITRLIVSTDDEEIADVSRQYGVDVPFLRPRELARDETPHLPVIQHAVSFMEDNLGIKFEYVVIFQPTSPFRVAEDIDGTVKKLIDSGADSAVSVCEVETTHHPIKVKKLEGDRVLPYCLEEPEGVRRQDLPKAYKRSGAVYAMRRDLMMEEGKLFGRHIVGYVVPQERSIDIDTLLDWIRAEYLLAELKKRGWVL